MGRDAGASNDSDRWFCNDSRVIYTRSSRLSRDAQAILRQFMFCRVFLASLFVASFSAAAYADIETYVPTDKGYYLSSGFHNPTVQRTFVDWDSPSRFNSFFVFDLQSLTHNVSNAVLRLELEGYFGPNAAEWVEFFPVMASIEQLVAGHTAGPGGLAIFGDLGDGEFFGSAVIESNQLGSIVIVDVPITPFGISQINASKGSFLAIGARLELIDTDLGSQGVSFSTNSGTGLNELVVLTVPEPCAAAMLVAVLFAIATRRACPVC
jgi:hypothetical protein